MAKQIKNSDLVQPKLWQETVDETNALIKVLGELEKSFKEVSAAAAKTAKNADPGSAKGIKDINSATETLKKTSIEADKVRAQIAKAEAQRTRAAIAASKQRASQEEKAEKKRLKAANDLIRQRKASEAATKREAAQIARLAKQKEKEAIATEKAIKKEKEQNRAFNVAKRSLNELIKKYQDLEFQNQGNSKEAKKLLRQITFLDAKIKASDKTIGRSQRFVGEYERGFKGLGKGIGSAIGPFIGITAAIAGVTAGIRAATGLFREFGLVSAKVKAVSGATAEEFEALQTQAKELGRVTPFTASNVAQLQLELSKLGFTANEIGDASESILQFAIATDSELGRSAEVVASTLNAFQLEAGEAGRVADVAAKAFSSSALDIEKFATAISNVGPAANAVDVSLERTTAILGKIVDSGVDASSAGTQLRNVFIELESRGLTWSEAMEQINSSQNSLTAANDLFGKKGATVATVIANNVDEIDKLDESLQNAEGSAKAAADIIGDTLDGDIKKLQSAIQGATLENEGFEKVLRKIIQFLTKAVVPVFNFFVGVINTIIDSFKLMATIAKPIITIFELLGSALSGLAEIFGINTQKVKDASFEFNIFTFTLEVLAKVAENINNTLVKTGDVLRKIGGFVKDSVIDFKNWVGIGKEATTTVGEVADSITKLTDTESSLIKFGKTASVVFTILTKGAKDLFTALGGDGLAKILKDVADEFNRAFIEQKARDAIKNTAASINDLNERIKEQQDLIGKSSSRKEIAAIQETIKVLEDKRDALLGVTKAQEDNTKAQEAELKLHNKRLARTEKFFKDKKEAEEKAQKEQKEALEEHNKELAKTQKEFDDAAAAREKKIQESTVAALDVLDQAFAKSSDNRINEIDREIQALQDREDALRQAAQNGSEIAKDNLATNQRLQAEQELIREEQVKKAQRREIVLAGFKAYAENAGEPGAANKTLQDAIKLYTGLNAIIPQFYDGTEDTGQAGQALDSNGGRLAVLHDNERVMTKKQNAMMGGVSNDEAAHIVHDHINMTHFDQAPIMQVQRFESNAEVLQKFDVLAEKLDNLPDRMPRILDEKFDEKAKVYTTVVKTGNKVEKNHKRIGSIWG